MDHSDADVSKDVEASGKIKKGKGLHVDAKSERRGDAPERAMNGARPARLLLFRSNHDTRENLLRPFDIIRRWRSEARENPPEVVSSSSISQPTITDAMKQTRVFTVRSTKKMDNTPSNNSTNSAIETPISSNVTKKIKGAPVSPETDMSVFNNPQNSCATAILQHSYLELCGSPNKDDSDSTFSLKEKRSVSILDQETEPHKSRTDISDDPTVQESIECVFASELGENLALMLKQDEQEDDEKKDDPDNRYIVAPSVLEQSLQNRSDRALDGALQHKLSKRRSRKLQESVKLVHVGTYDPSQPPILHSSSFLKDNKAEDEIAAPLPHHSAPCACTTIRTPVVEPSRWPQRPLMLRPSPGAGTVIKGIRKVGSTDYLWKATPLSTLTWPNALRQSWGQDIPDTKTNPMELMCPRCMILPINNGNEAPGESLVCDFESELFEGTLLLRMRFTEGTTSKPYCDEDGYFHGMNRRYQAVVQGRFKESIPFTQCVTGFILDRPCGKLPQKWILKGGLKVLSFFAPQLQAEFEGPHPSSLTPLGSTPQVLSVQDKSEQSNIEEAQMEPTEHKHTLLGEASDAPATLQRARYRKKQFDKLFTQKSPVPVTDPCKVYTFEFLQHLVNFNEFSIELGSMLGAIKLQDILDGQPLQIMATVGQNRIWSFDVWHETLVEESLKHDQKQSS